MVDPAPVRPGPQQALAVAILQAWEGFFTRFRPDEHDFERVPYIEESAPLREPLAALVAGTKTDPLVLTSTIELLEGYAQRRFEEQNRRIDELMDLCEQMRQRLEHSELIRSHLEDEFSHCQAIVTAAMERLRMGPPRGLAHEPRLHNLFNHILSHFEPQGRPMDTERFQRTPEHAKRLDEHAKDEPVFDYERLRRLFRKS